MNSDNLVLLLLCILAGALIAGIAGFNPAFGGGAALALGVAWNEATTHSDKSKSICKRKDKD